MFLPILSSFSLSIIICAVVAFEHAMLMLNAVMVAVGHGDEKR